jgi:TetR/AcrR family tetracycline transcriptional repressor
MDDRQAHREWHEAQRLERMREIGDQNPLIKRARDARLEHVRTHHQGRNTPRQEEIISAALELLNDSGLSALSLREIAKRLNIRAPALYWYFKSKDELVDYMAQAILMKKFADLRVREADQPWQDWMRSQMVSLRRAMLAYTDGGRVVAGAAIYPATALSDLFEASLASLTSAGLDLQTAYHIAVTASRYTFGYVIEEQASPSFEELGEADVIAHLAPYPLVTRVISELDAAGIDEDADFVIGLDYILKGSAGE